MTGTAERALLGGARRLLPHADRRVCSCVAGGAAALTGLVARADGSFLLAPRAGGDGGGSAAHRRRAGTSAARRFAGRFVCITRRRRADHPTEPPRPRNRPARVGDGAAGRRGAAADDPARAGPSCRPTLMRCLVTSGNAVDRLPEWARGRPVFAVGTATAGRARRAGFTDVRSADGDAAIWRRWCAGTARRARRLLLLTGKGQGHDARRHAAASAAEVTRCAVYEAVPAPRLPEPAREALGAANVRCGAVLLRGDGALHGAAGAGGGPGGDGRSRRGVRYRPGRGRGIRLALPGGGSGPPPIPPRTTCWPCCNERSACLAAARAAARARAGAGRAHRCRRRRRRDGGNGALGLCARVRRAGDGPAVDVAEPEPGARWCGRSGCRMSRSRYES